MGKKGNWLSAIKRVFLPHSKDKLTAEPEKRSTKEKKKKRLPKLKHGESNSFLPMFKEPSSIEKILDEAEREHNLIFRPPTPPEQPRTPSFVPQRVASPPRIPSQRITSPKVESPRAASPRAASPKGASPRALSLKGPSPRAVSPKGPSPRAVSPKGAPLRAASTSFPSPKVASPRSTPHHKEKYYRPEPTPENCLTSAIKIQAAYRGYAARRSFRALKGLVRLQGVMRGQNVKRQVSTALKYMQLFVRVQNQVQSRRIEMLEKEAQRHAQFRNGKDAESTLGKWSLMSEAGNQEDWDDSKLTKEQVEARLQRKVEAAVKRERAKAYVNSNQRLPKLRSTGFPWWCNWLERQLPLANPSESEAMKNAQLTPGTPLSESKPSPRPSSGKQIMSFDNIDTPTPRSTKSTAFISSRQTRTPVHRNTPGSNSRYSRTRASGADSPFAKDDDSLVSCPPFSVPHYMAPTASAQAKARASSNPRERFPGTPGSEKRRMSFPLTPGTSPFKWNKDSASQVDKQSVGQMSVDSTVSMPALVGRKPFNRFV